MMEHVALGEQDIRKSSSIEARSQARKEADS